MTRRLTMAAAGLLLLAPLGGCDQLGALLGVGLQAIPKTVDAAYKGLAGQRVVVMVWADKGVKQDFESLPGDVAAALQDKLINVQKSDSPDALKGMTFPFATATVVQSQEDHPEWQYLSATDVAVKFRATRLIYVEVTDFATRSAASLELYKGTLSATLKVIRIDDDGHDHVTAKVDYQSDPIDIVFPKDSPKDGLPNRADAQVAQGTIDAFADLVSKKFYKHDEDRD
jgi:hypothetical protein